jgi:hypothetical protein
MEIHCLQFSHKPEDIRVTSTNFNYDVKKEIMTMRHDYKPNVTSKVARDSWFENGAIAYKKHLRKYDLSETNLIMTFDIRIEPKVFDEFNLYKMIKLFIQLLMEEIIYIVKTIIKKF